MFVVSVKFVVKSESAANFLARVGGLADDSLTKEPDCYVFDAHLASDHFKAFDHEVAELVISKTVGKWVTATV